MHQRDKRRTIRVACSLPIKIRSRTGWMAVRVIDISRGGVRIALPDGAVGVSPRASLLDVARRLGAILPERIDVVLGDTSPVERRLRVVRIGKRDRESGEVELGCLLDLPLEDSDATNLGLVLPREGETWEQAERRLQAMQEQQLPR